MLSEKELAFIEYWGKNRINQKKNLFQFIKGFSSGFLIGLGILLAVAIGWYHRANMEVSTSLSPILLGLALLIVAVFMAFIYRNYQWEQNEQLYLELKAKMKKSDTTDTVIN